MPPGQPFHVSYSGEVRDSLRLLLAEAAAAGVWRRVVRALREIEGRLELDPRTWGDPVRQLRHADVTVFRRVHDELVVEYGAHDSEPLVWITAVAPVLSHPLRGRDGK